MGWLQQHVRTWTNSLSNLIFWPTETTERPQNQPFIPRPESVREPERTVNERQVRSIRSLSTAPKVQETSSGNIDNAFTSRIPPSTIRDISNGLLFYAGGKSFHLNREALESTNPGKWFSGDIINGCMKIIQQRSWQNTAFPKCYSFDSYLLHRIEANMPIQVQKLALDSFDLLIFPVNTNSSGGEGDDNNNHWSLVIADNRTGLFKTVDSINSQIPCFQAHKLQNWLIDSYKESGSNALAEKFKAMDICALAVSPQENDFDCGPIVIKAADWLSRDLDPTAAEFHNEQFSGYRLAIRQTLLACGQQKKTASTAGSPDHRGATSDCVITSNTPRKRQNSASPVRSRKVTRLDDPHDVIILN